MKIDIENAEVVYDERSVYITHPNSDVIEIYPDNMSGHLFKVRHKGSGQPVSGFTGLYTNTAFLIRDIVRALNTRPETKRRAAKRKYEENHPDVAGTTEQDG